MTTAAKATWNAAVGEAAEHGNWSTGGQTSRQFSVKDMPAHTKLKYRQSGQHTSGELRAKDLREEAEAKERAAHLEKLQELGKGGDLAAREELRRIEAEQAGGAVLLLKDKEEIAKATQRFDDRDDEVDDDDEDDRKGKGGGGGGGSDSDSDLDSSDSDDDDDDDDEELLRLELEKIKKEREEARRKQEEEEKAEVARRKEEEINAAALKGNPLLAGAGGAGSAQIKRKWNDDVVFKNQSRGEPERKGKRFINDTIRNDFHKAFLKKYMK